MSAVLSVVGSFELQLENEQKWLIYGPATRTHARARTEQEAGEQTARTTNTLLTAVTATARGIYWQQQKSRVNELSHFGFEPMRCSIMLRALCGQVESSHRVSVNAE